MQEQTSNQAYYDAFSANYEAERAGNRLGGYHDLIDQLEAEYVERFGRDKDVLEVGCGTGLLLQRIAQFAASAQGVDISPGMLEHARARNLAVREGNATALPFEDESFDVVCSFKVLAHVEQIDTALQEMARVVRPGGYILAEFYNPWSLRAGLKRLFSPGTIAPHLNEAHVYTRYDSPRTATARTPKGCVLVGSRGVRIVIPNAGAMRVPVLGSILRFAERRLCDSLLSRFGGFWIAALRKDVSGQKPF